jgi:hypothetical protein
MMKQLFLNLVYPSGKPMIPHLLRCQGFAVAYYGFTLDALDLEHPRLSLNEGNTLAFLKGCFVYSYKQHRAFLKAKTDTSSVITQLVEATLRKKAVWREPNLRARR